MEPERSLPNSQTPAIYPYPQPAPSNPCIHLTLPEDSSHYYPPIYAWVSTMVSSYEKSTYEKKRVQP